MTTKTSTVWIVERSDWFGDSEMLGNFDSKTEADTFAKTLRREARAIEDPADKVRFTVTREKWTRPL